MVWLSSQEASQSRVETADLAGEAVAMLGGMSLLAKTRMTVLVTLDGARPLPPDYRHKFKYCQQAIWG